MDAAEEETAQAEAQEEEEEEGGEVDGVGELVLAPPLGHSPAELLQQLPIPVPSSATATDSSASGDTGQRLERRYLLYSPCVIAGSAGACAQQLNNQLWSLQVQCPVYIYLPMQHTQTKSREEAV